jgi:hypothetical protein
MWRCKWPCTYISTYLPVHIGFDSFLGINKYVTTSICVCVYVFMLSYIIYTQFFLGGCVATADVWTMDGTHYMQI